MPFQITDSLPTPRAVTFLEVETDSADRERKDEGDDSPIGRIRNDSDRDQRRGRQSPDQQRPTRSMFAILQ